MPFAPLERQLLAPWSHPAARALLDDAAWLSHARQAAATWRRRGPSDPLVAAVAPGVAPSADEATALREALPEPLIQALTHESEQLMKQASQTSASAFMRYLHDLRRYPLLTPLQEVALARLAKAGNTEAADTLVRHNLRFVIMLAKKYSTSTVLFEDLVQEGNLGLMRAVTRFDPDRGVKLVSYAAYWIEQAIRNAIINQQRTVRLPANRTAELTKIRQAVDHLRQQEQAITPDLISQVTGVPVATVEMLMDIGHEVALDGTASGSGQGEPMSGSLLDRLPSEQLTDSHLDLQGRAEALGTVLATLMPRDATILRMCFGINYPREYTLEEIGEQLSISRERVRQIRDRALKLLQSSDKREILLDFWGGTSPRRL